MSDWRDLELDEITEWPLLPQLLVIVILCFVVQGMGYWFWIKPMIQDIEQLKQKELSLKSTVKYKYNQVAAMPKMENQLNELNLRYEFLAQQLPAQKELASMLSGINQVGIQNKLTFTRIDWGEKQNKAFLYKLPLNIELTGQYHNIGSFSEAMADLPRIVSLENIDMQRVSTESSTLHFRVMAYTYQFKGKE
ncbi:type 4a pilus biogenesis protein PilO [Aliivibrio sp. S4TY2]|uniref:type 4a pilus biogenesis protein PilO n=1 Tax=unclassified Aliivibrio TaxID=2645654 RepID=UPI0023796E7C|nr:MULTISPECIES: type 4a pilus biogenesis protein PilO [unclassified Aliivibrio]MDD9155789.1 type 4a pilus biogenesis protein PilO [Aliivibrio sp. S4TY2]MDD9159531.1 type 4a pilus biogenesis protein PilO [Aliivibrio sp. S4TY1]MDD9163498.1 type 4a pilus biogenesis protein PilO [Aliivibrio sp. S4MY2]MDD9167498.1 type 4a pilus biogenesis protein PilO [Aliivibrio sp. S4MY4]MDD9186183.1 type 4a pilus biogenesis protein PilO [Aliivibrio sp. S4MY3]